MYRDAESALLYALHRYYDSAVGRFITEDPLGRWFDVPNSGNGYALTGSRYRNMWDPLGLAGLGPADVDRAVAAIRQALSEVPDERLDQTLSTIQDELDNEEVDVRVSYDEERWNTLESLGIIEEGAAAVTASTKWGGFGVPFRPDHQMRIRGSYLSDIATFSDLVFTLMHEFFHVAGKCHHPGYDLGVFKALLNLWRHSETFRRALSPDMQRSLRLLEAAGAGADLTVEQMAEAMWDEGSQDR